MFRILTGITRCFGILYCAFESHSGNIECWRSNKLALAVNYDIHLVCIFLGREIVEDFLLYFILFYLFTLSQNAVLTAPQKHSLSLPECSDARLSMIALPPVIGHVAVCGCASSLLFDLPCSDILVLSALVRRLRALGMHKECSYMRVVPVIVS